MARVDNPRYAICIICHRRYNISKSQQIPENGYVCYKYKCITKEIALRSCYSLKADRKIS